MSFQADPNSQVSSEAIPLIVWKDRGLYITFRLYDVMRETKIYL